MNNFGVYYVDKDDKIYYICSCGKSFICDESMENYNYICKCGNKDFKKVSNNYNGGIISTNQIIKIENESYSGFIINKIKYKGKYNKKNSNIINVVEEKQSIVIDFKNNIFTINNNLISFDQLREFFQDICDIAIIKLFKNDNNKRLINIIKEYLQERYSSWYGCKLIRIPNAQHDKHYQKNRMMDYIIYILIQRPDIQILNNAKYNRYIIFNQLDMKKSNETKPHKIIGLPKYICYYVNKINCKFEISRIKEKIITFNKKVGADNFKFIFNQMLEECDHNDIISFFYYYNDHSEYFLQLIQDYKLQTKQNTYKPKQLSTYLFRNIKLQQGIINPLEGLNLLKDYIIMSKTMQYKYEKYPTSLKKVHDIMSMNYNVALNEEKEKLFKNVINTEEYLNLKYSNKKYSIVIPKSPKAIIKEGKDLSHCVASYVDDVIKTRCKILFMRNNEDLNNALITIEVRKSSIRQIRGFGNRPPNQNEKDFIKEWGDKKRLKYFI